MAATARVTRWGTPRRVAQLTRAEPGACHREALHYTSTDGLGGSLSVRTARARASRAQQGLDMVSQTSLPQHAVSPSAQGEPALPRAPEPGGLVHTQFAARRKYLASRGAHRPSAGAPHKVCPGRPPLHACARQGCRRQNGPAQHAPGVRIARILYSASRRHQLESAYPCAASQHQGVRSQAGISRCCQEALQGLRWDMCRFRVYMRQGLPATEGDTRHRLVLVGHASESRRLK